MISFEAESWRARLAGVPWFSAVGASSELVDTRGGLLRRAESLREAAALVSSAEWEAMTADAGARLTGSLHQRCIDDFQQWNEIPVQVKGLLGGTVAPAARHAAVAWGIELVLVDCASWDVLNAVMEETFAPCEPPQFFSELLAIYEAGHLPCYWDGAWPAGVLVSR